MPRTQHSPLFESNMPSASRCHLNPVLRGQARERLKVRQKPAFKPSQIDFLVLLVDVCLSRASNNDDSLAVSHPPRKAKTATSPPRGITSGGGGAETNNVGCVDCREITGALL